MRILLYLHECHRNFFGESLLIRALESLVELRIVHKIAKADLIITGPGGFFYNKQPLFLNRAYKIRNFIISKREPLQVLPGQITLFYSPEPPTIGHYQSSNCLFGVSSELLNHDETYFRLPYWMESLDWSDYGIRDSTTDRVGVKSKAAELAKERDPSTVLSKTQELAIITSHLNGLRFDVVDRLQQVVPIHGFGPYYNREIKHHSESDFTKLSVLSNYAFNLCPENTIYPGYVTEKILEAYACKTIPITIADTPACSLDFNTESFLNLYENFDRMADHLACILQDRQKLSFIAAQPLFVKPPSLDPFLSFLKKVLAIY
jgi:hypothetical protein